MSTNTVTDVDRVARMRMVYEGEPWSEAWEGTLAELIAVNEEVLSDEDVARLRGMAIGDEPLYFGGGAGVATIVARVD